MREIDLPCTACGASLAERVVFTTDLPVEPTWTGSVIVAECRSCEARYYPRRTLARLSGPSNTTPSRGDS